MWRKIISPRSYRTTRFRLKLHSGSKRKKERFVPKCHNGGEPTYVVEWGGAIAWHTSLSMLAVYALAVAKLEEEKHRTPDVPDVIYQTQPFSPFRIARFLDHGKKS